MSIQKSCSNLRRYRGKTQLQVAMELGVSPETISAFENGRTNNARVLCWYLRQVRTWDEFKELVGESFG